jgi:hypothetical protein
LADLNSPGRCRFTTARCLLPPGQLVSEQDAFPAEVRDDVQPTAQRLDVAGQGTDLDRAGPGALDGQYPFLPHAHPAGDLRLGQPEPDALLRQRPRAVRGDQGGRALAPHRPAYLGAQPAPADRHDLGTIAASALAGLREDAGDRGLADTADLGAAPALGDPRLAERLVANLADNAVRHNVTGGQVEVTAGSRDGRAFLTVTNTGPVIPPDQLGRLFQPFQRLQPGRPGRPPGVDGSRQRGSGQQGSGQQDSGQQGSGQQGSGQRDAGLGLGLGLAIVSAIAAAHGAELQAVTRAAGGLAVEVIFPRVPAEAADRTQNRVGVVV